MPSFELSYDTIDRVNDSWEQIRRVKNYEQVVGKTLFKNLLTRCPEAKPIFGFPEKLDTKAPQVYETKPFLAQACVAISMLDANITMLGPDMDLIQDNLIQLSERFARFDASPNVLAVLGDSLLITLQEVLGESHFSKEDKDAWLQMYSKFYKIVEKNNKRRASRA